MKNIDRKINKLRQHTSNFLFIEYYSHEGCECYKILNEHTKYGEDKRVLCPVDEGFSKALDIAISAIIAAKQKILDEHNALKHPNDLTV